MEGQANHLAEWEALGDWRLGDAYAERMLSATPDEVAEAVRRHLDPGQASMVVYRPATAPTFAANADAAFAALDAAPSSTLAGVVLPESPGVARAAAAPVVERVHGPITVFRTARGVPILVRRKPGAPIVHLGLYALGGASLEPAEQAGISTLLARTTLKGTGRRSAEVIAMETELLGGSISPTVTSDGSGWTLSVTGSRLAAGIDLLADVALDPLLPDAAFETERAVALSQLAQLRDDMMRYPIRLASSAAFPAHAYGRGTLGSEETVRALKVEDARAWHAAHVKRAPCVLAVVGDVEPADVAQLLATAFASLEFEAPVLPTVPAWPTSIVQVAESRDKAQTALALAFSAPSRRDASRVSASLIAGVASGLGGRFFDQLRDKQSLAYTVHATSTDRVAAGMFLSYIATSPENEEVARVGLLQEFAKLREDVVTDEELQRARTYALGVHAISQQSGGNVLAELVDAWLYGTGLEELDGFAERLRAVTPEGMRALAREHFDPDRRVEGIVRGRGAAVTG